MKYKMFSVFDTAVGAYTRPFAAQSAGAAIRAFEDDCVNADSPVAKHPEDYALFLLGSFDDNNGLLVAESPPLCLVNAIECVAKSREVDALKIAGLEAAVNGGDPRDSVGSQL